MEIKNVGITGASGILGTILSQKLKNININHICFRGDVCSKKEIRDWICENRFSAVIHLAAIVPTVEVMENPERAHQVNVVGTENLIDEIVSSKQNPWFFYASTSHVYKSRDSPISEEDAKDPISEYGKTKYEAENVVTEKYKNFCIGRIFSFFHDTQQKPFLYPSIKERLVTEDLDKPFELYGAQSVRDFLNAEEVVEIIIKLMNKKTVGIYNIASGKGVKVRDFVQGLTDKELKIKETGDSDYLVADISKLNKALGDNIN